MFGVKEAPGYVREARLSAARLEEQTTPDQYGALKERALRLLEGLFTVDIPVDPDLMVKIALRERFVAPRIKQAIIMVATHQLIANLAASWRLGPTGAPGAAAAAGATLNGIPSRPLGHQVLCPA
jgi:hypothetical protein